MTVSVQIGQFGRLMFQMALIGATILNTEAYMFDRQAGQLRELIKDEVQANLKEMYDSIEQEDREHEEEFEKLKSEHLEIEQLLDSCLIPRKRNDREMSLTERFKFLVQRQGVLA